MKSKVVFIIALISLVVFTNCDDSSDEKIPRLSGQIEGSSWKYQYSKAFYNSIEERFDVEMYGENQTEPFEDRCSIFISGETHLSVRVPFETGYYAVPGDIDVVFELSGTGNESYTAVSGYVEVVEATSQGVSGVLQAVFDENNSVEGSFSFSSCN